MCWQLRRSARAREEVQSSPRGVDGCEFVGFAECALTQGVVVMAAAATTTSGDGKGSRDWKMK
jgi:hypothetical protein